MRFCVPLPCFFPKENPVDAIPKIKSLGYDAVETYNWKDMDLSAVKSVCEETGVEFLSMCTTEFRMTDPSFRAQWLAGLTESCQAAQKAGVGRLITQVGPDTGAPREQQHESILAALEAAKPILADSGVILMLEPLNLLVDHPGYYLWSAKEGFEIIREAGHPNIKLVYDIYHQQIMEGNILPSVTQNLDCIAHLHAAGHPGRHELQYGENDYKVIFEKLDQAGYTGACGLEYTPLLLPDESLRLARSLYGSDFNPSPAV